MGAAAVAFLTIGPALGIADSYGSYVALPWSSRLAFIVLLTPAFWRS